MEFLTKIIWWLLEIYFFVLLARLFIDLTLSVKRSWRPTGLLLPVVEVVMTITDPPLKLVRKVIPRIRFGTVQLDLGWAALVLAILLLQRLVLTIA